MCFQRPFTFRMAHLKHLLIQQSSSEHDDPLSADDSVVPSQQIQGLYPLTVQVQGHSLVLDTIGYSVPSGRTRGENEQADQMVDEV